MDKSWMRLGNRLSNEYLAGVNSFMELAKLCLDENNEVRCPCRNCQNAFFQSLDVVESHLYLPGISASYERWIFHGEELDIDKEGDETNTSELEEEENDDEINTMLEDLCAPMSFENHQPQDEEEDGMNHNSSPQMHNKDSNKFVGMLNEAQRPLFHGCKLSLLNFVVKLMHIKVLNQWSNKSFNMLLELLNDVFPKDTALPKSTYDAKKMLSELGLGYEAIHACKYDCALFWKEHEFASRCPECDEPRYKPNAGKGKKVPQKVLRYFPLKTRLQRLFISRHTAIDMRWHSERRVEVEGVLRHPADGEAWKEFDKLYPEFMRDPRNVRLGLATDGFNPFGNMHNSYSMWPVILVQYNMPPWKCMKEPFMMMSLLIPGPHAPGRDIDIYLRPLVDELKELWEVGIDTFDAYSGKIFSLRAAIMWTINDFPAYGNLSGWSTKGYKACPTCNENTSSQGIRSKICFMGHRRYLPPNHPWRKSKLHDGKWEIQPPPKKLSGDDILKQLEFVRYGKPGKHPNNKDRKRKRTPNELNWSKKSIFFELEYWSKLKIRHNLDVMHIEKNVCDNIVGTLLNIEGKTKDTDKARLDLQDMKIRKELHLQQHGTGFLKPHASYTLTLEEKIKFCKFLKSVKFPDGYASNISNCVRENEGKISGLKTHDCHVLLQQLLPVGIRKFLRKEVCNAIVELSCFFQKLCSRTLNTSDLEKLEDGIVIILCKLERIFPPALFDVMVHLVVHLPEEAKLGGPVAFRWMYPIERILGRYKRYVKNKARPEGSIAEAYIVNESLNFCSMYLYDIETRFNRPDRNDNGGTPTACLSIFSQNTRQLGRAEPKLLSKQEIDRVHWYILNNCDEVRQYLDEHMELLQRQNHNDLERKQEELFPQWFASHIKRLYNQKDSVVSKELYALACKPDFRVFSYSGCIVNGVRFLVLERDNCRTTQNSGVMVPGDENFNFFGVLCDVVEVIYIFDYRVTLFQCNWYDNNPNQKRTVEDYHLTSINVNRNWYVDDSYILAIQAQQVFYMDDLVLGPQWKVVQKVQHRGIWDIPEKDDNGGTEQEVFQENESSDINWTIQHEDLDTHVCHRGDVAPDIIENSTLQIDVESLNENTNGVIYHPSEDEDDTWNEYYTEDEKSLNSQDDSDDSDIGK
ncbi:Uncharacterized protein Adt_27724 [Abeliophyllum distichum]|uniref:Transposase n=1 Tax=Abeliophyllum distichum TaxID=126358 RepID=A0ABD1RUJ5_9LAMI